MDYQIPDCGSVLVESPNYPNNYRNLESCQWLLRTEALTPIRITILDFDTEEEYDRILIGNGANPSNSASQIAGPLSGSLENFDRTVFTSNGDRMWITFTTDDNKVKQGFSIQVEDAGCVGKNMMAFLHNKIFLSIGFNNRSTCMGTSVWSSYRAAS